MIFQKSSMLMGAPVSSDITGAVGAAVDLGVASPYRP